MIQLILYELFERRFFCLNQAQYQLISKSLQNRNNIKGEDFHKSSNFSGYFPSSNLLSLTFIYCCLFCCTIFIHFMFFSWILMSQDQNISFHLLKTYIYYLNNFKACLSFINSAIIKHWYHYLNTQKVSAKWIKTFLS